MTSDYLEPIANLIGRTDFFEHDIMIVPYSQIPPDMYSSNTDVAFTSEEPEAQISEIKK